MYNTVVEDVIANVREAFLDEGVDEQVLQELRQVSNPLTYFLLSYDRGHEKTCFLHVQMLLRVR